MGDFQLPWVSKLKTCSKLENLQNKMKTCENRERFEGRTQRLVRDGGELTLAENGEKSSPISAKGPLYRWLARPRSGAESASACMPCSAAEHKVRRPNLVSLTYAFGGLRHTRNACMFGGRTWVFLQGYFHAKTHFLSCLKHKTY